MHGDCKVDSSALAKQLNFKKVNPCPVEVAERHTGYKVGGTSPFGLKSALPIYMEKSIAQIEHEVFINGGGRGVLVSLLPSEIIRLLRPSFVNVAMGKTEQPASPANDVVIVNQ